MKCKACLTKHQLQNNYKETWLVWFKHEQLLILVRTEPLNITITTITSCDHPEGGCVDWELVGRRP